MEGIEFKDLEPNKEYNLFSTQFNAKMTVKCLANYNNMGEKVYFTRTDRPTKPETLESMKSKFENNIMPFVFVAWKPSIGAQYIITEIN